MFFKKIFSKNKKDATNRWRLPQSSDKSHIAYSQTFVIINQKETGGLSK